MFFHIVGIKEIAKKNYNLDFLLENEEEKIIREILWRIGVVILSIEKYSQLPSSFGTTQLVIATESWKNLTIIEKSKDYRKTFFLYSLVGLDVIEIHSIDSMESLNKQEMLDYIKEWRKELNNLKKTTESKEKKEENSEFKVNDYKITEIQLLAGQVILKSKQILETMKDDISPQLYKNLDNLSQELLKAKLGTNIERMKNFSHEIITIIDTIEKEKISRWEIFEQTIFNESSVTNVDIIKEVQKREKAEEIKRFGGKKSKNDSFYIFFGKVGIYFKLLWKDIINKLKEKEKIFFWFFRLFWLGLYTSTILFWLYNVYLFFVKVWNDVPFIKILINLWIASSLYLVLTLVAKKRVIWVICWLLIAVVLYFILSYLVANTLSF